MIVPEDDEPDESVKAVHKAVLLDGFVVLGGGR